jgi:hypothetical protein
MRGAGRAVPMSHSRQRETDGSPRQLQPARYHEFVNVQSSHTQLVYRDGVKARVGHRQLSNCEGTNREGADCKCAKRERSDRAGAYCAGAYRYSASFVLREIFVF